MNRSVALLLRVLVIGGAVFAADAWCVHPFWCNRAIATAKARTDVAMLRPAEQAAPIARGSIDILQPFAAHCHRSEVYVLLAMNESLIGRPQDALRYINEALACDQRPEYYYDRGLAEVSLGNTDAAVMDLATAVRFDPAYINNFTGELRDRVQKEAEFRDRQ